MKALNEAAAAWLQHPPLQPGRRFNVGGGTYYGGDARWSIFLYARAEGVGVGFNMGGERWLACCLHPIRSGTIRPLAYVPIGEGFGAILVQVGPLAEQIRYECFQCGAPEGLIPRHANGRSRGLPQIGIVFVSANRDGANDGFLVAYTGDSDLDRDRIGLPPVCPDARCPVGLTWGVLQLGAEKLFSP